MVNVKYSRDTRHLFSDLKADKDSREVRRIQTCHMEGKRVVEDMTYMEYLKNGYLFRSVFTGLTHARRDVLVVDMDMNFDSTSDEVLERCVDLGIQLPNVMVVNRREYHNRSKEDQFHYQLIWFTDTPWIGVWNRWEGNGQKSFNWMTRTMATLLGGDTSFKGTYYKNPYCDFEQESIWLHDEPLPRKRLEAYLHYKVNDTSWLEDVKSASRRGIERINCGEECNSYSLLERTILECYMDVPSRNVVAHKYACKMGLSYMCRNKGEAPTVQAIKEWVVEAEKVVADRYGIKEGVEPSENIASTARSVYLYIKCAYNPSYETDNMDFYDKERADQGRRTQKVTSEVNHMTAIMLRDKGTISCARDLVVHLGVKLCTAREYLRNPISDEGEVRKLLNDWFLDYTLSTSSDKAIIKERIVELFEYKGWEFSEH